MAGGYLSARPLRELRPNGSSASRTSPEWLVRFANFARMARPLREPRPNGLFAALTSRGLGLPHSSALTSRKGTARRAPTPSPLTPHPSLLTPHSSLLTPHSSLLTPHPSPLTPHSSLLTPHPSPLTPHPSPLTPHSSPLTPHSSLLTPQTSVMRRRNYPQHFGGDLGRWVGAAVDLCAFEGKAVAFVQSEMAAGDP